MSEIRDRFGRFNLALIPTASGSLSSRFGISDDLVKYMHAMPDDAVEIFHTLTRGQSDADQSEKTVAIAIHHSTFDSKRGARRTMENLRAARITAGRLGAVWSDGGLVVLQAGAWRDLADLWWKYAVQSLAPETTGKPPHKQMLDIVA
jgi:hypothetical protein